MSNIAGKAYAMNLMTPLNTTLGYLCVFFVPGLICILNVATHLLYPTCAVFPVWAGMVSLLAGVICLGLGVAQLLKIIRLVNEFVIWLAGLICFLILGFSSQNIITCVITALMGLVLLAIGINFLRLGIVWLNKFIFWLAGLPVFQKAAFDGLLTLSLIHYARWVIIRDKQFPRLSNDQPKEELKYGYMFFFTNFNGSWTQYVDSFSMSIAGGLNLLWFKNIGWLYPVPESPFNEYVISNQIWTEHYYSAYPMASSNDIKSAQKVKKAVLNLSQDLSGISAEDFWKKYNKTILEIQSDISMMEPTPVVSLANEAIAKKTRIEKNIA